MATRHQARRAAVSLLYARDLSGENEAFVTEFLEKNKIRNEQKNFTLSLLKGVSENLATLDSLLELNLKEFNKLSRTELAILRLSSYELCFSDTQKAIIINEAIELSKSLGNENSPKLINAVLDKIKNISTKELEALSSKKTKPQKSLEKKVLKSSSKPKKPKSKEMLIIKDKVGFLKKSKELKTKKQAFKKKEKTSLNSNLNSKKSTKNKAQTRTFKNDLKNKNTATNFKKAPKKELSKRSPKSFSKTLKSNSKKDKK